MNTYTYYKNIISPSILKKDIEDVFGEIFINIEWNRDAGYIKINFNSEITIEQKTQLDNIINDHVGGDGEFFEAEYSIKEYVGSKLSKEIWYNTDNGDGTYSDKFKEIEYVWDNGKVIKEYERVYCKNGALWSIKTYEYYTGLNNSLIKKKIK